MTKPEIPLVLDQHKDSDWKELPDEVRESAEVLGYTKKLWNRDKEPEVCEKDWEDLNDLQREAAKRLGYTKQTWDEEDEMCCCSEDSDSHDEPDKMLVLDQHEDSDWKDLPKWVLEAAEGIGYTKEMWNRDEEPIIFFQNWENLAMSQQEAAKILGYNKQAWDEEAKSTKSLVLDEYEDSNWSELPQWIQEAAKGIGYTKKLWNRDKEPALCGKHWIELSDSQREAAVRLRYTKETWDEEAERICGVPVANKKDNTKLAPPVGICLEDVHKHLKWTIYCIQLYTETKDYQFRVNEGMGLSMFTNRVLEAEEFIVKSTVGPRNFEELFEIAKNGVLSDERRGFAERFLEWQQTYLKMNRVGAQNAQIDIRLEDFSNPSITSKKHRPMPSKEFPVFDLEIFEHEIVIVEFVPPPTNPDYELPPSRRFEILHYDEGLVGLDGEEGYDPREMKRPPTLCGIEQRSLELPGHFTNHASGASSTAFDFLTGSFSTHLFPSEVEDIPEWLAREISAKKRAAELDVHEHLTTRRALEPGTEITTDYSRWHWSNADYLNYGASHQTPHGYFLGNADRDRCEWNSLSPKIQRAARILGYTQALWESGETPCTFEKSWKNLSLQEQEAAINLTGHNEESWNEQNNLETESDCSSVISLLDLEWIELSEEHRKAAVLIGHNENTWNESGHEGVVGEGLYFYNIRPEFRDAMVVLGETEATWEDHEDWDGEHGGGEPWFLCLCGDTDCHSSKEKGGFRGVKYFPFEEQRKLAFLCEPWVQQQISWSMYQLEQQEAENAKRRKLQD
mmetsp:Transcript_12017/g.30454  ORF Transcript_12017/g.30454 Transcript_12017/m.30454 type:complete len:792 (-) Transcript_12017:34-2409(-)